MNNEKQILLSAIREAGAAILALQQSGFTVTRKANNDLLTQADVLANDILKKQLSQHFPADGWLSEETVDNKTRLQSHRVWVVDPIDGTREYAQGIPEYAISVALVESGIPIVSAVFNPATDELFYAVKNQGAWLGDKRIHCMQVLSDNMLLLASRSEYKRGEWNQFQTTCQVKQVGSIAYKLAMVAAGYADATFSLGPKSEWDIAAGVLLVIEAGGSVTNQQGDAFMFNQRDVLVDGIVASSAISYKKIVELINDCA